MWLAQLEDLENRLDEVEIRGSIKIRDLSIVEIYYIIEYWKPNETCCHSDSSEKSSVNKTQKNG